MLGAAASTVAALVIATGILPAVAATAAPSGPMRHVIVVSRGNDAAAARRAVTDSGGRVERALGIIHGFSAMVPADRVATLAASSAIGSVSPDVRMHATTSEYGPSSNLTTGASDPSIDGATGAYDPSADVNSMASTTGYMGATAWWDAGATGRGVDIALIDSGVAPVQGLSGAAKVVYGPDLSFESQSPDLTNYDTFGHGTFMAGLIAGRDDGLTAPYSQAPADQYRGVAPDSRIISLKVATADGGTDVSQVIAAIDWVVQHKDDAGFNIRVLSLSYGTDSMQSYTVDPLAYAAEVAWKSGIVVVAAAGNTDFQKGGDGPGLADPAYDPYVIAAGASDSMGTAQTRDDVAASFSAAGCGSSRCKDPDFLAPGRSIQGLRDPGSYIDMNHPEGLLGDRYFRGSGTSEATAIAAGSVALILQRYPALAPDDVKKYFTDDALRLAGSDHHAQGAGEIRPGQMINERPTRAKPQRFADATGTGSLERSRGSDHVSMDDVALSGEQDIFGHAFDSASMALMEASGKSWSGGTWNGNAWTGDGWAGGSWAGKSWSGSSWTGKSWSSGSWSGNTWSGKEWSGKEWSGKSWSGKEWSGDTWAAASWS